MRSEIASQKKKQLINHYRYIECSCRVDESYAIQFKKKNYFQGKCSPVPNKLSKKSTFSVGLGKYIAVFPVNNMALAQRASGKASFE